MEGVCAGQPGVTGMRCRAMGNNGCRNIGGWMCGLLDGHVAARGGEEVAGDGGGEAAAMGAAAPREPATEAGDARREAVPAGTRPPARAKIRG